MEHLEEALGVRRITARCLAGRGLAGADEARSYLDPKLARLRPPAGLAGLPAAVERLTRAVLEGQRVGIFGDYDVDGVTTTALITHFLRELGVSCVARVAHREAGYGFGVSDADGFASAGCRLVITGDCGTGDLDAIERAGARGVDVIVVDHHTVPPEGPAHEPGGGHPAVALVNPLRRDSTFPFRSMASVGLAFYLVAALRTSLHQAGFFRTRRAPDPRALLDLVALGTVADLVPLQGENRILTALGLRALGQRRRPGVAALMEVAQVGYDRPVDERTIGWRLGPRLNAPGRMGDAQPALELLLARTPAEAADWAARIDEANQARRAAQGEVLDAAEQVLAGITPGAAVIVAGQGWPSGVTGIVAARLLERFQRPVFVVAMDERTGIGRGSGRAPAGWHLYEILARCAEHLVRFGGHAGAAGLTVRATELDALRAALCAAVESQAAERRAGADDALVDAEVGLGEVDEQLCRELEQLAPFGRGNESPLFGCRGMRVRTSRRVGDGSHLKLEVEDEHGNTRSGIAFGQGELDPGPGATIAAAFAPKVSVWRGEPRVELEIQRLHV
ncbi:single-stranded-DNA-specific exonuclease RecJ [Haliangium sp.]|uniref:single-stranded-DNA-specific exonuclease RecJ n=1 Tax=Haliangium sp. TaxID=2663208 RepID=UPI003D0A7874